MDHTVTHLGHGYWHQITLGHVYKHHLGALRLFAVAVVAVALLAVAADLRLCLRVCPISQQTGWRWFLWRGTDADATACRCRMIFLRDATVVTVTAMFLRGATVVRVMFLRDATAVTVMFLRDAMMRSFLLLRRSCCRRRFLAFPPTPPLMLPPFSFRHPFTIISCIRLWRP